VRLDRKSVVLNTYHNEIQAEKDKQVEKATKIKAEVRKAKVLKWLRDQTKNITSFQIVT